MFAFDYLLVTRNGKAVQRETDVGSDDAILLKFVVAKESRAKAFFRHGVSTNGIAEDRCAVDCLVDYLTRLGNCHVILKSDNENAILKRLFGRDEA